MTKSFVLVIAFALTVTIWYEYFPGSGDGAALCVSESDDWGDNICKVLRDGIPY